MRVLVHQAEQHAAHEALGRVPLKGSESQKHGNCRHQPDQHGEYVKSILFPEA